MVDMPWNPTKPNHIDLIYMYKEDLVLNNLQWLICHQTQPTCSNKSEKVSLMYFGTIFKRGMNFYISYIYLIQTYFIVLFLYTNNFYNYKQISTHIHTHVYAPLPP